MSNRGYYGNRRRPHRRRITGRFYAFLTVVVVLVVMTSVFFATRNGGQPANNYVPPLSVAATQTPEAMAPSAPEETPVAPPEQVTQPNDAPANGGLDEQGDIQGFDEVEDEPIVVAEEDKVQVDNLSTTQGLSGDWRNILLLGSDTRNLKKVERTDTIIIASINVKDGRIKLTSIMRDMIIPINGKDRKVNSASSYGGVDLTVKLINEYFDMNITEYVLVNFASFQKVVDILGGIEMDVTKAEMDQINSTLGMQAKVAGYDSQWFIDNRADLELKTYGKSQHLTGIQALGYARIRKIDSDYQRTDRQRKVLDAILQKVKKDANLGQFLQLATSMWEYFDTNIDMIGAVGLATTVIKNGVGNMESGRIPANGTFTSRSGSAGQGFYDVDYAANAQKLHTFIYGN